MINAEMAREKTDKVNKDGRVIELEEKHRNIFKYINRLLSESVERGEYKAEAFLSLENETSIQHLEEIERVLTHNRYKVSTKIVHLKEPKKHQISYLINISWERSVRVSLGDIRDIF